MILPSAEMDLPQKHGSTENILSLAAKLVTMTKKHGKLICISSVFQCFCGNKCLPQANRVSFSIKFVV